jgi:regulator of RNase E activity RraB
MSLFGFLFGCDKDRVGHGGEGGFVSEQSFRENLSKQVEMSQHTLERLRTHGVEVGTKLRLEFFFYTDAEAKAQSLAGELRSRGYDVEAAALRGDTKLMVVTGWTMPIRMDIGSVTTWIEEMARLGFDHDCEFDGWGTYPQQ